MIMSLDRLARSTKHLLQVVAEFHTLQIDLISLKEKVDTTTSVGKEFYTVLADLMQCQAALVREHIRRGMRRAKLDGVRLGRAPLNVDHEALVADRLGGMSLTAAATKWRISRASVVRLVREAQRKQTGLPVVVSLQPETAYVV
jgi:DNA invertase Pin-like site-specific DNA recombinase